MPETVEQPVEQTVEQTTASADKASAPLTPEQIATRLGDLGFDTSRAFRNLIEHANNIGLLTTKEQVDEYRQAFGGVSVNLDRIILTALEMRRMLDIAVGEINSNGHQIAKASEQLVTLA
jgi:hypothetical protein